MDNKTKCCKVNHEDLIKLGLPLNFAIQCSSNCDFICEGLTKEQEILFREYISRLLTT